MFDVTIETPTLATLETDIFYLKSFLAKRLLRAYREGGPAELQAKINSWGNELTPDEIAELKEMEGIPNE